MKGASLALAFALSLSLSACSGARLGASSSAGEEHALLGVQAPGFDLAAQSGGARASLADAAGKLAIVDFWATWCDPCRDSFASYQRLSEQHAGALVVIGISVDEEPSGIEQFARETGARFVLAWDEGQAVSKRYAPPAMPTSFMLDQHGIVRHVHAGFRSGDAERIESKLASLLK
jgi:cytochrome c biogenesis protein CcmG, thiol:disulfide interchange protein DsbE